MLRHHGAAGPSALPHDRRVRNASPGQTHQVAMAGEPLAQARRLRRRLDPAVDRLGRHHEDGRTRIDVNLLDLSPSRPCPAGDEHHFAHAGLFGCAPLNEQSARSVVSVFDVDPDEGGGQVRSSLPRLPLSSVESGDPRPEGRVVMAHPYGIACLGQRFRHRIRHSGYPADHGWKQPRTAPLRGCFRSPVRSESDTRLLRQDQPAPAESGW